MSEDIKQIMDSFPSKVQLSFAACKMTEKPELDASASSEEVHLAYDDAPPEEVIIVMQFSEKGFGFGEISIKQTAEGVFLDTEYMSLATVKKFMNMLLDSAIMDTTKEPEKHALYNKVMGRSCNERCESCYPAT